MKFPMTVSDASAGISTYSAEFFDKLEEVGYGNFREEIPKNTTFLILKKRYTTTGTTLGDSGKAKNGANNEKRCPKVYKAVKNLLEGV